MPMYRGLCIKGLDAAQISTKLSVYLENHVTGFTLPVGQSIFQENYLLHFEDVMETIPRQYHHLFTDTDKFSGLSGFIQANEQYTVMLLADETLSKAYLLTLQYQDTKGGEISAIIGDFLCS